MKTAREYSYLGLYKEASSSYKNAIKAIKEKIAEKNKLNSFKIEEQYQALLALILKEEDINSQLLYLISNACIPPQQTPKQKKLPFNTQPFAFKN